VRGGGGTRRCFPLNKNSSTKFNCFHLRCTKTLQIVVEDMTPRYRGKQTKTTQTVIITEYSKPSLIRLQFIRFEIWKTKSSVHSWVHTDTWDLGARGLSDCVEGSWRDWNHARKYPRLVWAEWRRPWISASDRNKLLQWFFYLFPSALPVLLLGSRDSLVGPVTRCWLVRVPSSGRVKNFLFSTASRPTLGSS
jgi:hypothetical protein